MVVRDAAPADFPAILALNEHWVHFLSPMPLERLEWIHSLAEHHRVVDRDGEIVGFLMGLREGTIYDSPNYAWFAERYDSFLYVDRVVVAESAQGLGIGKLLYNDVFSRAREAGVARVAAEFYTVPPNETSARFHARYGFSEVGTQWLENGKCVSLQVASAT